MIVHRDNLLEQNQFENLEFLLFMDLNMGCTRLDSLDQDSTHNGTVVPVRDVQVHIWSSRGLVRSEVLKFSRPWSDHRRCKSQTHFLMTSHHYYVFVKIEFVLFEQLDNHQIQHEKNTVFDILDNGNRH